MSYYKTKKRNKMTTFVISGQEPQARSILKIHFWYNVYYRKRGSDISLGYIACKATNSADAKYIARAKVHVDLSQKKGIDINEFMKSLEFIAVKRVKRQ